MPICAPPYKPLVRRGRNMQLAPIIEGYDRNFADQMIYDVETRV